MRLVPVSDSEILRLEVETLRAQLAHLTNQRWTVAKALKANDDLSSRLSIAELGLQVKDVLISDLVRRLHTMVSIIFAKATLLLRLPPTQPGHFDSKEGTNEETTVIGEILDVRRSCFCNNRTMVLMFHLSETQKYSASSRSGEIKRPSKISRRGR